MMSIPATRWVYALVISSLVWGVLVGRVEFGFVLMFVCMCEWHCSMFFFVACKWCCASGLCVASWCICLSVSCGGVSSGVGGRVVCCRRIYTMGRVCLHYLWRG